MNDENLCKQCGGLIRFSYILGFERSLPREMSIQPPISGTLRLCPGHPMSLGTPDWERLSFEQKNAIRLLRDGIAEYFIARSEDFYKKYPELRLTWEFTLDAIIREGQHT